MSHGPGVWQRGILAAVDQYNMVYIRILFPDHPRKRLAVVGRPRPVASRPQRVGEVVDR
jgi:hypothetical protein